MTERQLPPSRLISATADLLCPNLIEVRRRSDEARRFYEDVLGLEAEGISPTFVQFEHFAIATDEPLARSGEPEIYWLTAGGEVGFKRVGYSGDRAPPAAEAVRQGVRLQGPDGQTRYVLQLAADLPSRSARR